MNNVINLADYADRIKQASIDSNYVKVVNEFCITVNATVKLLNDILRDGSIDSVAYTKFSTSNARITDLIRRIDKQMMESPQRVHYAKQKARYKLVSVAVIGCYTASMY